MFDGDIAAEEEVLDWLIEMNVENHIELITRPMLENMVEEIQYLAVYFCKLVSYSNKMMQNKFRSIYHKKISTLIFLKFIKEFRYFSSFVYSLEYVFRY